MIDMNLQYAVGVDLGGTKIELGVVDEAGQIHQRLRLKTHVKEGPEAVEKQILEGIEILRQESGVFIQGVGIGVAGQIHPKTGRVIFAPNLYWHDYPLQENIEKALHLPIRIINDVRAITWGEWLYGAGMGCKDLLCIFVGTGIGSGIVSGGQLLIGCSNSGGEIGHITVDMNGPICTCGNRGCLEAFAGGWGIAERAKEAILSEGESAPLSRMLLELAGQDINAITAKQVVEAFYKGDALAQRIIQLVEHALIAGCASLINAFNPCRLILGGGFIDGFPEMIEIVNQGVRRLALKAATNHLEVVKAQLGKEVGVIGAAAVIFDALRHRGEEE